MNLKGHARIELTNVRTGAKEVVEHDNMITNAVYDLCNPPYPLFPSELQVPAINYNKPLVESLFGGIMLWEDTLNDDPDDYVFPHGVGCTGYACDKANAGVNNMMGTYNASESGYQSDGSHKKVWDFSTAQANGAIASLSLVPTIAGNIGWGVTEHDSSMVGKTTGNVQTQIYDYGRVSQCDRILYVKDGYVYTIKKNNLNYVANNQNLHISRNGGKLLLQKYLIPSKQVSLFNNWNYTKLVEEFEVNLPEEFVSGIGTASDYYYGMCMYDDRSESINIIITDSTIISAGTTIKMCRISISDYSARVFEITSEADTVFARFYYSGNSSESYGYYAAVSGNKLVITKYGNNKLAIIDITDNSVKEIICPMDGRIFSMEDTQNGYVYIELMSSGSKNTYEIFILDVDNASLKRLEDYGTSSSDYPLHYRSVMGVKVVGSKIHNFSAGIGHLHPFYHIMLTKNNLESPVTKTADKTMKITYTIKEV